MKETGDQLETKVSNQVLQPNGLLTVEGVATVCADEWDAGNVYTCNVTHPELVFPTQVTLQKTPGEFFGGKFGEIGVITSMFNFAKFGEIGAIAPAFIFAKLKKTQTQSQNIFYKILNKNRYNLAINVAKF